MANLFDNLVAFYKLNDNAEGSKVVLDSSGNDHYGASVRDTDEMHVDGKVGGALEFDGISDYVALNADMSVYQKGEFTFSFGLYIDSTQGFRMLYFGLNSTPGPLDSLGSQIYIDNGWLWFDHQVTQVGNWMDIGTTAIATKTNGWHLVTIVFKQLTPTTAQGEIYFDGVRDTTAIGSFNADEGIYNCVLANLPTLGDLPYIGFGHSDEPDYLHFSGALDNFMIFNKALTAAEIHELYLLGEAGLELDGGYYRIYRGQDGVIDYDTIQAVMSLDATNIQIPNQNLPANTIWSYVRKRVSDCGLESPASAPHRIVINSEGTMILSTPNVVEALKIEQLAGGVLELRWRYFDSGQEIIPTGFKIFVDSGQGFDFADPVATVPYRLAVEHKWSSAALTHGQTYKYCVRSYAANAGQTINTNFVAAKADSVGPAVAEGLSVSWEEV